MRNVPPLVSRQRRLLSRRHRYLLTGSCTVLLLGSAGSVFGNAVSWRQENGGGSWLGANWIDAQTSASANAPNGVGADASIRDALSGQARTISFGTITLGRLDIGDAAPFQGNFVIGTSLTFDNGGSDASFILNGSGSLNASNITLNSNLGVTIGTGASESFRAVSGSGGLTKFGAGDLFIGDQNTAITYTGLTSVAAGSLSFGNNFGGTVLNNAKVTFYSGNGFNTYSGAMSGSGIVGIFGQTTFTGANSYTGTTTINASATWILAPTTTAAYAGAIGGTGALKIQGPGIATLSNASNNYSGGTTITGGLVNFNSAAVFGTGTTNITLNGGGLQWATGTTADISTRLAALGAGGGVFDTNGSNVTLNTALSGAGGITKSGAGTLTLPTSSTYTGPTTINAGALQISGTGSLYSGGTVASTIAVNNGGTLLFSRSDTFGNHASASPVALTINQGGLVANNAAVYNTFLNLTMNGGELRAVGGFDATFPAYQLKGTVTVGGSTPSTMTAPGGVNAFTGIHLGNNTAGGMTTFQVADVTASAAADLTIANALQDGFAVSTGVFVTSGLIKTGPGTLTVTGNNTYTGPTTINAGTLQISGSGSLYTNGTVAGAIAVNNGGTLLIDHSDVFGVHVSASPVAITVNQGGLLTNTNTFATLLNVTLNGGTLRAAGGANANFEAYQLKGTVTAGGSTASLIEATNTVNSLTEIQLGNNTAGGSTTFNVADATGSSAPDLTISAVLQNGRDSGGSFIATGLVKTGVGTLQLSGANAYSGGTTVSAGLIRFSALNNFGTGNVTLNGGGVQWATGNIADISLRMNAIGASGGTFDTNGNDVTLGTALSGGALTKTGNGTLIFTVNNANTATTVKQDYIQFSALTQFGGSGANVTLDGGGLKWATGIIVDPSLRLAPLAAGGGHFHTNGNTETLASAISGTGALFKDGAGTLILTSSSNSYSGGTHITGGTLKVSSDAVLGNTSGGLFLDSTLQTLQLGATFSSARAVGIKGTSQFDTNGFNLTLSGVVSDTGDLAKIGSGVLTLSGANTFSGLTTISSAGSITLSNSLALQNSTLSYLSNGGSVNYGGGITTITLGGISGDKDFSMPSGPLIVGNNNQNTTYSGAFNGSPSGLTKIGTGTLTLTNSNHSYSGPTVINNGTLKLGANSVIPDSVSNPFSAITINPLGTLDLNGFTQDALGTFNSAGTISLNGGTLNLKFFTGGSVSGPITGAGTLSVTSGTVTLGSNSPLSGTVVLNNNANFTFGASGLLPAVQNINFANSSGTMNMGAANQLNSQVAIFGADGFFVSSNLNQTVGSIAGAVNMSASGATITFGGNNASTGASGQFQGAFIKTGTGTLTYTGNGSQASWTLQQGVLSVASLSNLGNGPLTFGGGTLKITGTSFSQFSNGVTLNAGGGTIDVADPSLVVTANGNTSGAGGLTKIGPGTLALSAGSHTGGTTVKGGTLRIAFDFALGDAAGLLTLDGGTLLVTGTVSSTRPVTLGAGQGTIDTTSVNSTFAGVFSGIGALIKNGVGGLTLAGTNTYQGGTIVNAGTLKLGGSGTNLDDTAPVIVNGGTFALGPSPETIGSLTGAGGSVDLSDGGGQVLTVGGDNSSTSYAGAIQGLGGTIVKVGSGILTLGGTSTYTGATMINGGALLVQGSISGSATQVGGGALLGGSGTVGPTMVTSGGTLAPGNSPGILTTGGLTLQASGTLAIELAGTGAAGTNYDQLRVTGSVSLNGNLQITELSSFVPQIGDTFFILLNDGSDAISGTFANAAGGTITIPFATFTINYAANGDGGAVGNDVALTMTAVPEPGSAALLLAGLGMMVGRRRRRK